MSDKNLRLQVSLSAIDKVTKPFKSMLASNKTLAASIKATKGQLKQLDAQSGKIEGFRKNKAAVNGTAQALAAARDKARQLATELKNSAAPTAKQAKEFKRASEEAAKLKQKYHDLRTALHTQRTALQSSGIATNRLGQAQRSLKANITSTTAALTAQQRRLEQQAQQQQRLSAARNRFDNSNQRKAIAAGLGYTSLSTGRAMGRGIAGALHVGYEFDGMMSKTQAVTRIPDKNSADMQAMRHQARTLPLSSKFTDLEVAQGQYFLGRTGYSPKQVLGAMPGMLNLAAAGDIDLGTTADIASNIQTAMGIPAEKMDRVADVLTALFTRNNVDIPMLGESMKYSAGVGREYGQSLETVAASTAMLGSAGIQGSQAGTTMRSILSRIGNSKAVSDLGVKTADKNGNMRDLVDILKDISDKTAKMGNVERGAIFKNIAGQYAVTGFGVLMHAAGNGSLDKMRGQPGEYDGEAARVAATKLDNLKGDMTIIHAALENVSVELFEKNDTWLRSTAKSITEFMHGVAEFLKAHPKISLGIVQVGTAVAIATAAFGALAIAAVGILGPFALLRFTTSVLGIRLLPRLSFGMSKLASTTPITTRQIGTFSRSLLTLSKNGGQSAITTLKGLGNGLVNVVRSPVKSSISGFKMLGNGIGWLAKSPLKLLRFALTGLSGIFGILMSPIGLIGAAIAGAGLLIYKYWKPIKAFLGGVVDGFMQAATPIKEALKPLGPVFDWIGDAVKNVWNWFKKLLEPVQSTTADLNSAADAGKSFGQFLADGINLAMTPLKVLISSIKWVLEKLDEVKQRSEKTRELAQSNPAVAAAAGNYGITWKPAPKGNSAADIAAKYTGEYDNGGYIPLGKFGVVGEHGPEIINGPAQVTGRRNTAAMAVAASMLFSGYQAAAAPLHPYSLPAAQYRSHNNSQASNQQQNQVSTGVPIINIYPLPQHDAQDIAREVARQLAAYQRQTQSKSNRSYQDHDD
ncbi:phage tail tape measure protein [Yersinia enterocolitica]|uniref:Tail length tape-measure protein n=15 Tax=root TaxID=1 RepID=A0AAE9JXB6_9CAUD|nr:phage tail tape measure protein [Yersinia enterocolitica]YP_010664204.1 tail length tape-measure protein [Yersinia phage vB_YenM_42.18]EKN3351942.1 phage tail tape measure protein [Yersinia enterocolitica]EKN3383178.1 phage tail tape measure protein [Yersinia enterocolitica]EKN3677476.1 phage tail tape measure protein [Yersinia enterocolitica]EKN3977883.1 phage tail tape measure protein [Yersinia enterocolitica]EKN4782283.1 phage tail tape measure protein [Yersinia enterocolitica]